MSGSAVEESAVVEEVVVFDVAAADASLSTVSVVMLMLLSVREASGWKEMFFYTSANSVINTLFPVCVY